MSSSIVAVLSKDKSVYQELAGQAQKGVYYLDFTSSFELYKYAEEAQVDIVISESEINSTGGLSLMQKLKSLQSNLKFILLVDKIESSLNKELMLVGIDEVFDKRFSVDSLRVRIEYLSNKATRESNTKVEFHDSVRFKIPLIKRIFDIAFAIILILILSPLLLLIGILIKLESRGPIIYYSLRVGTGYKTFKFYKFRSMKLNADKELKNLQHLNQYSSSEQFEKEEEKGKCSYCIANHIACKSTLYSDGKEFCEKEYEKSLLEDDAPTFIKIKNDPRVTKIGRIIRKTSIDELPQLYNVLIGDMSIVGNRPLPLYEAEKLTTDQFSERFNAPAGITGLWQVTKRGKGKMTEEERVELDNTYARNYSLWMDLQILFKTCYALVQKENV